MSFARHRVTATVVRDARDGWGRETNAGDHDIPGCLIAPRGAAGTGPSQEVGEADNTVITGATLYGPSGADILSSDKVRVRGVLWDVIGDIGDWGDAGFQVALEKSSG